MAGFGNKTHRELIDEIEIPEFDVPRLVLGHPSQTVGRSSIGAAVPAVAGHVARALVAPGRFSAEFAQGAGALPRGTTVLALLRREAAPVAPIPPGPAPPVPVPAGPTVIPSLEPLFPRIVAPKPAAMAYDPAVVRAHLGARFAGEALASSTADLIRRCVTLDDGAAGVLSPKEGSLDAFGAVVGAMAFEAAAIVDAVLSSADRGAYATAAKCATVMCRGAVDQKKKKKHRCQALPDSVVRVPAAALKRAGLVVSTACDALVKVVFRVGRRSVADPRPTLGVFLEWQKNGGSAPVRSTAAERAVVGAKECLLLLACEVASAGSGRLRSVRVCTWSSHAAFVVAARARAKALPPRTVRYRELRAPPGPWGAPMYEPVDLGEATRDTHGAWFNMEPISFVLDSDLRKEYAAIEDGRPPGDTHDDPTRVPLRNLRCCVVVPFRARAEDVALTAAAAAAAAPGADDEKRYRIGEWDNWEDWTDAHLIASVMRTSYDVVFGMAARSLGVAGRTVAEMQRRVHPRNAPYFSMRLNGSPTQAALVIFVVPPLHRDGVPSIPPRMDKRARVDVYLCPVFTENGRCHVAVRHQTRAYMQSFMRKRPTEVAFGRPRWVTDDKYLRRHRNLAFAAAGLELTRPRREAATAHMDEADRARYLGSAPLTELHKRPKPPKQQPQQHETEKGEEKKRKKKRKEDGKKQSHARDRDDAGTTAKRRATDVAAVTTAAVRAVIASGPPNATVIGDAARDAEMRLEIDRLTQEGALGTLGDGLLGGGGGGGGPAMVTDPEWTDPLEVDIFSAALGDALRVAPSPSPFAASADAAASPVPLHDLMAAFMEDAAPVTAPDPIALF